MRRAVPQAEAASGEVDSRHSGATTVRTVAAARVSRAAKPKPSSCRVPVEQSRTWRAEAVREGYNYCRKLQASCWSRRFLDRTNLLRSSPTEKAYAGDGDDGDDEGPCWEDGEDKGNTSPRRASDGPPNAHAPNRAVSSTPAFRSARSKPVDPTGSKRARGICAARPRRGRLRRPRRLKSKRRKRRTRRTSGT